MNLMQPHLVYQMFFTYLVYYYMLCAQPLLEKSHINNVFLA